MTSLLIWFNVSKSYFEQILQGNVPLIEESLFYSQWPGTVRKCCAPYLFRHKMKRLRMSLWAVLAGSSFYVWVFTEWDISLLFLVIVVLHISWRNSAITEVNDWSLDVFFSPSLLSCHINMKETKLKKTTIIKILSAISSGFDSVPSPITHAIKRDSTNKAENITSIIFVLFFLWINCTKFFW